MALSADLLSQFARVTNDKPEPKKETTAYGTAVIRDGKTYVKFDGSDLLTPVSTTTAVEENERVAVQIKNHTATITGNLSSPAARNSSVEDLSDQISEFEIVIADKISTDELDVQIARIDQLTTDNVTVKEKLTAAEAEIEELTADVADIDTLYAKKAEIDEIVSTSVKAEIADFGFVSSEDLEATNADINNLEATYAAFEVATADRFTAIDADIDDLTANKLDANTANITYAKIADLDAAIADIDILDADVADINTLIFGSATGDVIQTSFANAVIAQLGNAQIKAAQIESVSASQITAGDIITNNVKVMSEDGKLLISNETIQISDDTRVRVQIGKDASNDYSINIWDAEGNLMFSKGGITDSAIKNAIIRNDMVSENANISASKLNISSLFTEINNSSETIKSTQIYLDDQKQTLDVAFTDMITAVEDNEALVSSQGTAISVIQGQISSKIWKEDIATAVEGVESDIESLNSQYSEITQDLDSVTSTVGSHSSQLSDLDTRVDSAETKISQNTEAISLRATKSEVEETLSGYYTKSEADAAITVSANDIVSTVSATYATRAEVDSIERRNLYVVSTSVEGWLNANGALSAMSPIRKCHTSDYIPVSEGENYILQAWATANPSDSAPQQWLACCFYDSNKSFVGSRYVVDIRTPSLDGRYYAKLTKVVPSGVSYMRVTAVFYDDGIAKLEKGTNPTGWTLAPEDIGVTKKEFGALSGSVDAIRRGNLIKNGFGECLDNTNFTGATFIRDDGTCPEGCYGFFYGPGCTESIPYDRNVEYELKHYARLHKGASGNTYFSIRTFDVDGLELTAGMTPEFRMTSTMFYLAKDLKPGDTVVYFEDLTDWVVSTTASHQRSFVFYGYTDSTGYTYPDGTYSRNVFFEVYASDSSVDKTNNRITLSTAWTGPTFKAGVCVGHAKSGVGYIYPTVNGSYTNTEWKEYSVRIPIVPATYVGSWTRLYYAKSIKIYLYNSVADYCGLYLAQKTVDSDARSDISSLEGTTNDIASRLLSAESTIQQLSDAINMIVTDANGTTLLQQTGTGWSFNLAQAESNINSLQSALDTLDNSVGGLSSNLTALNNTVVTELGAYKDCISIGTYSNPETGGTEPCVRFYQTTNNLTVIITNQRILFQEGSSVPVDISDGILNAESLNVKIKIKHGQNAWIDHSGNDGIVRAGYLWEGA